MSVNVNKYQWSDIVLVGYISEQYGFAMKLVYFRSLLIVSIEALLTEKIIKQAIQTTCYVWF